MIVNIILENMRFGAEYVFPFSNSYAPAQRFIYLLAQLDIMPENQGLWNAQINEQMAQQNPQQVNQQNPEQSDPGTQLAQLISDLDRRLRTLEERYSNLRKKIQLTDQNLLESEKEFNKELHSSSDDVLALKRTSNEFNDKILRLSGEMNNVARKVDLMSIEKYLAMWTPTNYVTRDELKQFLLSRKISGINNPEGE
jgi:hypothetical protein